MATKDTPFEQSGLDMSAFYMFAENALDAIYLLDTQGQVIYANPATYRMFRYTVETKELVGRSCTEFFLPEDLPFVQDTLVPQTDAGTGWAGELRHKRADGTTFLVEATVCPICDAQGKKFAVAITNRDVTERKHTEEALRKAEERFKDVVISMSGWAWEVNAQGQYTFVSDNIKDLLGYEPAEVIGKTPFDLIIPEQVPQIAEIFGGFLANKAPIVEMENWNIHKNGGKVCFATNGVPILNKQGELIGYRGVDKDITARMEAFKQITMFTSLVENALEAVTLIDLEGTIIYSNRAAFELYGADFNGPHEQGKKVADYWFDEDRAFFMETVTPQVIAGGWNGEIRQKRMDGTTFEAEATVFPIKQDGQVTAIAIMSRDISERKQAEEEQRHLQDQVIEAQRQALKELATPIIPVMDRIIVMPLIGSIDTLRAKDITRALLAGISQYRAKIVIMDITGVPLVDSGVADHLNKTIQAARLKGAQAIVTGMSDAVAEAIVDLGIDWSGIQTLSDLQTGLIVALNSLGYRLSQSQH